MLGNSLVVKSFVHAKKLSTKGESVLAMGDPL